MNRMVIILDALRRDTAKEILCPAFPEAKFHELTAIDNYTGPVFKQFSEWIQDFKGWKGVICGGALAGMHFSQDELDFFNDTIMTPLLKIFSLLPREIPDWNKWVPFEGNGMWVIHDYFIHNYSEEIDCLPLMLLYTRGIEYRDDLIKAYKNRVHHLVPILQRLRKKFSEWEFYITTDHGEAFWEDGVAYHHGRPSTKLIKREGLISTFQEAPSVMDIWCLDFQNRDSLTQEDLFK